MSDPYMLDGKVQTHTANQCEFELCEFCGCCAHGMEQAAGCKMDDAPYGCQCPNYECGCEGRFHG